MFDRFVAFRAQQTPHAIAISMPAGDISFDVLDRSIGRVAAALAEEPHVGLAAVRVADPYLHWLLLLSLARLGIASTSVPADQDAILLPLLRPDLVISDSSSTASDTAPGARWLHASAAWADAAVRRPDSVATPVNRPLGSGALGRVATSSGTTGVPKKVAMSWRDIDTRVTQIGFQAGNTGYLTRLLTLIDAGSGSFLLALAAWGAGGTVLFASRDPVVLASALTRLRPTGLLASPIQLRHILDALPAGFLPLPDLLVVVSGSHTPLAVRRAAQARLTPRIVVVYASTEAGTVAQGYAPLLGTDEAACGWLVPWVEVEVVDDAGRPVSPGTSGLLRVRGSAVSHDYMDDPAATAEYFREGWFYPGDVGTLSADGALRVEGRADELMNFGGEKILPRLMEDAALGCPGVRDAAAFSLRGREGLAEPWLAIVREDDLDPAALDLALRLHLPTLPPIHVVWIEHIPRNPGGKVERDRLSRGALASAIVQPVAPKTH